MTRSRNPRRRRRARLIVIPREVRMISQFPITAPRYQYISTYIPSDPSSRENPPPKKRNNEPRFDQIGDSEQSPEDDANPADDDISDAEEGVFPAHDGPRGDDDGFGAAIGCDGEI